MKVRPGDDLNVTALSALIARRDLIGDERYATPRVRFERREELNAW